MGHLDLARVADVVLVAPASADCIAKAAHGLAGDVLGALLLATEAPVVMVPAMNTNMWKHVATQANVKLLGQRGVQWVGPSEGRLACGAEGPGRMAPVVEIIQMVEKIIKKRAGSK
jgi:phosphopantothenoylcysteine decarboxylase/phosphopantothenate--cysteine ligase